MVEITSEEQNTLKRMKRTEDSLKRPLEQYQTHQHSNYRGPEEEKKKKGFEKNFEEIIVENFPSMEEEIVNQVQEAQIVPYRINPRRNTPRHILIKLLLLLSRFSHVQLCATPWTAAHQALCILSIWKDPAPSKISYDFNLLFYAFNEFMRYPY